MVVKRKGGHLLRTIRNISTYGPSAYRATMRGIGAYKRLKMAYRNNRSRTKTRTKTRSKTRRSTRIGSQTWLSHSGWANKGNKLTKAIFKRTTPNYYQTNASFQIQSPAMVTGQQASTTGGIMYLHTHTPYDIFEFINAGNSNQALRWYLQTAKLSFTATNQSNNNVFIDFYTVRAKKNMYGSVSPYTDWLWQGQNPNVQKSMIPTDWGAKPTDSLRFRQNWQILKIDKHSLAPGEILQHNFKSTPNRIFNTSDLWGDDAYTNPLGNYGCIKNLTTYILPVCYGQAVTETTNESGSGLTSTGAFKVAFAWSKRYNSRVLQDNNASWDFDIQLPLSLPGGEHKMIAADADEEGYQEA